jgi:hypothetical protein
MNQPTRRSIRLDKVRIKECVEELNLAAKQTQVIVRLESGADLFVPPEPRLLKKFYQRPANRGIRPS